MRKSRNNYRVLSMILILTLVIQLFPATAFAQPETSVKEAADVMEAEEDTRRLEDTAAEIIGEIVEKREANIKYFRMKDGTITAAVYPYDIHYLDEEGRFRDINNEVYGTEQDGEAVYATTENEFQVLFSKKSKNHKLYTLRYGTEKIKAAIEGAEKAEAQITQTGAIEGEKNGIALEHMTQKILYEDILEHTDICYVIQGKELKENIILKEQVPFQEIVYQYQLPQTMEAVQIDEKTIFIQTKEDQQIVTCLNAPAMWDNGGRVSNQLSLTLTERSQNKVTVTLSWDKEWVDSEETVFPVVIDPVISSSLAREDIKDTHVMKRYPDTIYGNVEHIRMGGTSDWRSYSLIKYTLPSLKSGEKIVNATMYLTPIRMVDPSADPLYSNENSYNPRINITAHKINRSWEESTATYRNTIGYYADFFSSTAEDYCAVDGDGKVYSWDITRLVESWYSGENNGVLLQFDKDPGSYAWNAFFCSKNGYYTSPYAYPQFVVQYLNTTGIEDYFSSHIQNVGRAGTVYTNDLTGNLTLVNEIVRVEGGNMPIGVSLVYNTSDTALSGTPYGWGWKLNWSQCIRTTSLTAYKDGETLKYYQYIDGDGTVHYFLEDAPGSGSAADEVNPDRKITYSSVNGDYVMSDDSDTRMYFKKKNADEWYLYKIEDSYGNGLHLTLGTSDMNQVTRIESTSGNEVLLTYSSYGFLDSVSYYLDETLKTVTIGYNQHVEVPNNCISDIDYPDGSGADYYYYSGNNCISNVVDIDGYQMEYGYVKGNTCAPYRVSSVEEKGTDGSSGQKMCMSYELCNTEITDVTNARTYLYSFSETGTLKSVVDPTWNDGNGYGQYYEYNNKKTSASGKGNLTFESKTQKSTVNLLSNHGFEQDSDNLFVVWDAVSAESFGAYSSDKSMLGARSVKLYCSGTGTRERVLGYQCLGLEAGETYTLSAYVNTSQMTEAEKGASLFVDGNGYSFESEYLTEVTEAGEWRRLFLTFTPPAGGNTSICVSLTGAKGTVYFDNIQLEKGTLSEYNLLENAGFEQGTVSWNRSAGTGGVITSEDKVSGANSAKLDGGADLRYDFMQELSVSGKKGDAYVASAFAKACSAPRKTWRFTLLVRFTDSNGEIVNDCNIDFNPNSTGWQKVSGAAVAKGAYAKISVWLLYYNNLNAAWFDNVQLIKDTFGYTYTYDSKGNVVSVTDLMGQEEHAFQYDGASQLIKQTNVSGSRIFYAYNSERKQQLEMVSGGGVTTSFAYDSRGNAVLSRAESTEISGGKYYYIKNVYTGKYLTVKDSGTTDGTRAVAEEFQGKDAQKWKLVPEEGAEDTDQFRLSPGCAPSMYLCAESSVLASQGIMALYGSGKSYHTLKLVPKQENVYYLRFAANTGYAMDIYEDKAAVFPSHEGEAQQFVLEPCGDDDTVGHLVKEEGASYDKEGNLTLVTDSRGNHVSYSYLYARGVPDAVTDAQGNRTSYTYDEKNRLLSVTAEKNGQEISAAYTYNESDQITGITSPGGTQYQFSYDSFGRNTQIQAGTRSLRENTYDEKGLLTASTYGNGVTIGNSYDEQNRLTAVTANGQGLYRLNYDGSGRLIQQEDIQNNQTVKWEYDILDRLTVTRLIDGTTSRVVQMTETEYDSRNRVKGYDSFVEGITKRTDYVYGTGIENPDLITAVKLNGSEDAAVSYVYDGLNRLEQKQLAGGQFTTTYTYEESIKLTDGHFYPVFCEGRTVSGDFNGDGKTDLAEMYDYSNHTVRIHVWPADGNGGYRNPETAYVSEQFDAPKVTDRMTCGDYDGDGCDEIAALYDLGSGRMELDVFQPQTDESGTLSLEKETWFSELREGCFRAELVTGRVTSGDYDGDGRDEIAVMYDYGNGIMRILVFDSQNQGSTRSFSYQVRYEAAESGSYYAENATERMVSGDYDGDGRDEIAVLYDNGNCSVSLQVFDGSGPDSNWTFGCSNWYDTGEGTFDASRVSGTMVSGDFNGDGKEDLAFLYDYTRFARMLVFLSTGSSWENGWQIWDGGTRNYHYGNARGRMGAGDTDGDGREEVLSLYAESDSSLSVYVWEKEEGDSFRLKRDVWNSSGMVTGGGGTTSLVRTLVNGDTVLEYTYDKNGNILSITENGSRQYDYHYDSLGQLVREDHTGKETIAYTYDSGGNLSAKSYYAYTDPGEALVAEPVRQELYGYGDPEWKDLLTTYNGETITYDGIGNPLTYTKGRVLTWQNGRRLASITDGNQTSVYTYNAEGIRTSKTVGEGTTRYIVNGSRILCEVRPDGTKVYFYYDEGGSLLSMEYGDTMYYYIKNLQGDIVQLIDETGNVAAGYQYDTWGKVTGLTGEDGEEVGLEEAHIGNINPFRYRGYYYDAETGFYYVSSRYYDPEVGRFISADGEISGVGEDIRGYNLYSYCFNNPVNLSDPDGNWPSWAKKAVAAVAFVAVVAVVATVTVATVGAGSVAACVAIGAAKGAAIGATVGAVTGAVSSAVKHRVTTGSWKGSGKAAIDGAASGALSGAITGAITGGISNKIKNVCFVGGTSVLTSSGYVVIEDISVGDKVWSENLETGEKELKEVVQTFVNETDELVHVYVNGEEIITTPEHPFYVPKKGWVGAIDLRAGDILVLQSGEYVVIEMIQHEILESPVTVYNFEVEDFHTYYVGESAVLVHNVCGARNTPDQDALIKIAKDAKKTGLSRTEADIMWEWTEEIGLSGLKNYHPPKYDSYLGGTQLHMKINGMHINIFD